MSLTEVNIDIAECMNNVCGASTMPYKVMRIDFLRWISLIIRCSLDLTVGVAFTPSLYDSILIELTCMLHILLSFFIMVENQPKTSNLKVKKCITFSLMAICVLIMSQYYFSFLMNVSIYDEKNKSYFE